MKATDDNPPLPRYMTPAKYAELTGISLGTQRQLRHSGDWLEGREFIRYGPRSLMNDWRCCDRFFEDKNECNN